VSIRLRLTLWYVAVMALILVAVAAGVYGFTRERLERLDHDRLAEEYGIVASLILRSEGDVYDLYHLREALLFRLVLPGGEPYLSLPWEASPLPQPEDEVSDWPRDSWRSGDGRTWLLRSGSVPEFDFGVVVAHEVTGTARTVRSLAAILLAVLPVALLLAVGAGWFLAGRALAPVAAMTAKAREISAEQLSARLPVARADDEFGRLATVFNETLARLEDSFGRLRRFTADASHELRTPLTAIRSVGEVALREAEDAEACREAIGSMLEETDRLTGLTDDLLTLARGETGKARLAPAPTDLTGLVGEVVDELRVLAEEKEQDLAWAGGPPITATVDAAMLRQAVTNVLHNAIRYTDRGGRVKVAMTAEEGGAAVIDVDDEGPGIPPGERRRVFERFVRLDPARSSGEGGAGLGLAIARQAVEANGGAIAFLDGDGPGSRCRITLPLA
jgi:heavy metal sensor kinase